MNKEETIVLQLLTGDAILEEASADALQQLANEHPYFSAAQLLLAKKMQQANHPDLQQQLYKTALHFPNEQWLRYLLFESKNDNEDVFTAQPEETEIKEANTNHQADTTSEQAADLIVNDSIAGEQTIEETTEDKNLITLPAEEILEEVSATNYIQEEPEEAPLDDDELQQQVEPLPLEESGQKIASLLSEQAEAFHKPVGDQAEIQVGNEPFHTVDYFASLGIKLDSKKEENSLDKKVHKFTDWLRQMKRINPHPADLGTGKEEEDFVVSSADSSNFTKEVITESMADVLLKQGKTEKAIEVYQKLSLLYPHKNTYFAALIQQIK